MGLTDGFDSIGNDEGEGDDFRIPGPGKNGFEPHTSFSLDPTKWKGVATSAQPELPWYRDDALKSLKPQDRNDWSAFKYGVSAAVGKSFLDMVPYGKYAYGENRKQFMELSKVEQHEALAYDTLENLLFYVAVPAAFKGVGMAGKGIYKKGAKVLQNRKIRSVEPVEDAIEKIKDKGGVWESYSHEKSLESALKEAKVFTTEEQKILQHTIKTGSNTKLTNFHREKILRGEKISPALDEQLTSSFKEGTKLSNSFVSEYSYDNLQAGHWRKIYRDNLRAKNYSSNYAEGIFNEQGAKMFEPEALGKLSWDTLTDKQAANLILGMFEDPITIRASLGAAAGNIFAPILQPMRNVFGAGERAFKTNSGIFKPARRATENSNRYKLNQMIRFGEMLHQRGFGEMVVKNGIPKFKANKKLFSRENLDKANEVLTRIDELTQKAVQSKNPVQSREFREAADNLKVLVVEKNDPVSHLVKVYHDYHDKLYADAIRRKVPLILNRSNLTEIGKHGVDRMMMNVEKSLQGTFSSSAGVPYSDQMIAVQQMFKQFRKEVKKNSPFWFKESGDVLEKKVKDLQIQLTVGGESGFPRLLENYAAKIYKRGAVMDKGWNTRLHGDIKGFWTRERKGTKVDNHMVDYMSRVEARTASQAKDLYTYPVITDMVTYAEKLPEYWRKQTDHLIARMMNRPSSLDAWVAESLENTIGRATQLVTGDTERGLWNAAKVQEVAQHINNFTYAGFLGFKPFSAMRNLFQPLVTGLADIGGISDIGTLIKGAARGMSKQGRAEINRMGIITDFVPEMSRAPVIANPGMVSKWDNIREVGMWMFRQSDRWNRRTMAGAAMVKWERAVAKYGQPTAENMGKFFKKAGISRRNPWVVAELEHEILHGGIVGKQRARQMFIKDVVADTQYLYGSLEAPTAISSFGATGKVATTFNSWWMNYASLVDKWYRTAQGPGGKAQVTLTWMFSSAVAEQTMETLWGRDTALRQAFLGPLPMEGEFMPPAFDLVFQNLKLVKDAGQILFGADPMVAQKQMIHVLKQGANFIPGGNQGMATIKAYKEGGGMEALKSIPGFTKKKEPSVIEKLLLQRKGL